MINLIKKIYDYSFYCFYRLDRVIGTQWFSEYKATLALIAIEIWLVGTILGYLYILFDIDLMPYSVSDWKNFVFLICLVIIKERVFYHKKRWKLVVNKFDKMPSKKNNKLTLVFYISLAIFFGLIALMLYLLGRKSGTIT